MFPSLEKVNIGCSFTLPGDFSTCLQFSAMLSLSMYSHKSCHLETGEKKISVVLMKEGITLIRKV